MQQSKLFNRTRWQLASGYALVMGLLLSLGGVAMDQIIGRTQQYILRQKLESLAGILHDSLEPLLKRPGQIEFGMRNIVPGLCLINENCPGESNRASDRHIVRVFQQEGYYLRFLDRTGQKVAFVGEQPVFRQPATSTQFWQTLQNETGDRFSQVSILLRTQTGEPWGYLQIGRSLSEWDNYFATLRLTLLLGLPVAIVLIGVASWWLAGLAMQPIYRSYRQMQQFTSDAAHELRTPLTIIQTAVEETRLAEDLLEVHQNLDMIDRQNVRLSALVKDLLLICRIEQQRLPANFQRCCLNDLITDLVEELASLAIAADISLKTISNTKETIFISADNAQIYRTVSNLITNAIHYTPSGGDVIVTLDRTDRDALISVQDTGIGIAPQDLSHIFDRFYRVQSDRSRTTGGAGLGLAISQAIVQAHQGKIEVQSNVGKGSIFTIYLPLRSGILI